MNKEEILNKYIDLIDKGYCSDCNELNCIDNFSYAKITHAIRELQQENQELKKQLEISKMANSKNVDLSLKLLTEKETQQKEFIKWLKDNIDNLREIISDNRIENNISHLNYLIYKNNLYTEILQKYKEIIGGNDV